MTKALFTARMMMQMRMCMYMCKLCDAHFPARSPKEAKRYSETFSCRISIALNREAPSELSRFYFCLGGNFMKNDLEARVRANSCRERM